MGNKDYWMAWNLVAKLRADRRKVPGEGLPGRMPQEGGGKGQYSLRPRVQKTHRTPCQAQSRREIIKALAEAEEESGTRLSCVPISPGSSDLSE